MPIPQPSAVFRAPAERMLIVKIVLALGLALLLVVGAWSTSHREADAHSTLCLAAGGVAHGDASSDASSAPVVAASDTGIGLAAAVCCFLLVLLLHRASRREGGALRGRLVKTSAPPRAGPRLAAPAPDLIRLSISRT